MYHMIHIQTQQLIIKIPIELHKEFKLACIMDGKTMRSVLIELIERYISNHLT